MSRSSDRGWSDCLALLRDFRAQQLQTSGPVPLLFLTDVPCDEFHSHGASLLPWAAPSLAKSRSTPGCSSQRSAYYWRPEWSSLHHRRRSRLACSRPPVAGKSATAKALVAGPAATATARYFDRAGPRHWYCGPGAAAYGNWLTWPANSRSYEFALPF